VTSMGPARLRTGTPERTWSTGLLWLVVAIAALSGGCIIPPQEAVKKPPFPDQKAAPPRAAGMPTEKGLVKPFIPEDSGATDPRTVPSAAMAGPQVPQPNEKPQEPERPVPSGAVQAPGPPSGEPRRVEPAPAPQPSAAETAPAPAPVPLTTSGPSATPKPGSAPRPWEEDQKVKQGALGLAKASPAVKKIKICYSVPDDEWWVILYEDINVAYDLKQFVWSRERERLEPHLVVKTIPKDQMEQHVRTPEKGMECEVLEVPQ
jgi:hypothetical protein